MTAVLPLGKASDRRNRLDHRLGATQSRPDPMTGREAPPRIGRESVSKRNNVNNSANSALRRAANEQERRLRNLHGTTNAGAPHNLIDRERCSRCEIDCSERGRTHLAGTAIADRASRANSFRANVARWIGRRSLIAERRNGLAHGRARNRIGPVPMIDRRSCAVR